MYDQMKDFPAFLFLIKTNFNKLIGTFVHSKFENTKGMKFEMGEKTWDDKLTNN